jgi:hypothetical protein
MVYQMSEFRDWFAQYCSGDSMDRFHEMITDGMAKWRHLIVVEREPSVDLRVRQRKIFKLNKEIKAFSNISDYYPYVAQFHVYMIFFFPDDDQYMAAASFLSGCEEFQIEG